MNHAPSVQRKSTRRSLRLSGIDWRNYSRLLYAFVDKPGVRLTYDRGELEIMSPRFEHENDGYLLGRFVVTLTEELGLPLKAGGSVTLRRKKRSRGLEADECFWIANAHRMAGRRRLDLRTDPPPDLAIEDDVTHSSLDRQAIYAELRVPEVSPLDGDLLKFHILGEDGNYTVADTSRSFPLATPADLMRFLQIARQTSEDNEAVRQFRAWVVRVMALATIDPLVMIPWDQ